MQSEQVQRPDEEEAFLVDLPTYEGPLHLLLELARSKKIDLIAINVLEIVDQFLLWYENAKSRRIELAADWLVMAATLALLKSRLLIPVPKEERAAAEAFIEDLSTRLRRLDAVRMLADELLNRRRLGIHWHAAVDEAADGKRRKHVDATLHSLLSAYVSEATLTMRPQPAPVRRPFLVLSVEEAIRHLQSTGAIDETWRSILDVVPMTRTVDAIHGRSKIAASYVAALDMAKRGKVEVRQSEDGLMVEVRRREAESA